MSHKKSSPNLSKHHLAVTFFVIYSQVRLQVRKELSFFFQNLCWRNNWNVRNYPFPFIFLPKLLKIFIKKILWESQEVNLGVVIGWNFCNKRHCFQSNPPNTPNVFLTKIHAPVHPALWVHEITLPPHAPLSPILN